MKLALSKLSWRSLLIWVKLNYGLLILLLFLTVTTLTNLPAHNHWLMGWDNFSVGLDVPLNLDRTFFATWREYRGFGVPSDSEVVDVFRQLPLFVLSWILPDWTLEWIYYFGMYWLGALGAFCLTATIVKKIAPVPLQRNAWQLAGLVGALAYATNLYTIDVFYFPITLYIVRHGMLPWILWSAYQVLTQPKPSPTLWLWFAICILFASPGALTATVFFVTALIIGLLLLCLGDWRRKFQVGLLIMALQVFWLLPFANYYIQKSASIPKASTFVTINEMLLNQPFERFSFDRLLTFSADFTSGAPFKTTEGQAIIVHPGLSYTPIGQKPPLTYWSIWIPTVIGICILTFWQIKQRNWRNSWLLGLLIIGIVLLRKEYPPTGAIFDWLGEHISVLKIVLRFGGAKLNPLFIVAISVLSGLAAAALWGWGQKIKHLIIRRTTVWGLSLCCALAVGWMGWYMASGSLYFQSLSVEIPTAYFQAAQKINTDPDYGRVLHLPYGIHSYWRSHSFGYYGSSFLAFLLDKPLQDKTFNPGNLDHNAYDLMLTKLIANTSQLTSTARINRAIEFAAFLSRTNTTYIIWDPTVSTYIRTEGLVTWELLPHADTNTLLQTLVDAQLATVVSQYDIPEWAQPTTGATTQLKVLKLNSVQSIVTSPPAATAIDASLTDTFNPSLNAIPGPLLQDPEIPGRIYPWWDPSSSLVKKPQALSFALRTSDNSQKLQLKTAVTQPTTENDYVGVDVFARYENQQIAIYFRPTPVQFDPTFDPQLQQPDVRIPIPTSLWAETDLNTSYTTYLNNWHVLGEHQTNQFRLVVNDQVLPLPSDLSATPTYLSSVLLPIRDLAKLPISILIADPLTEQTNRHFSGNYFSLTPDPNCWQDKFAGYTSTFSTSDTTISASTTHGTLCFGASIDLAGRTQNITKSDDQRRYFELEFVPTITSTLDSATNTDFPLTQQQQLQNQQVSQPTISSLFVCLMSTPTGECLNKQRFMKSTAPAPIRVTSHHLFAEPKLHILMTLPTFAKETQQLQLSDIKLIGFSPILSTYATLNPDDYTTKPADQTLSDVSLTIPYFLSAGSLYTNPATHAFQIENRGLCQLSQIDRRPTGQQHLTELDDRLQIYLDNCATNVSHYLPYFPTNAYWWSIDYQRLAGGQPQFLANTSLLLADELLGLNQGYPFANQATAPKTAKTLIAAQGKTSIDPTQLFSITQYTANQSLVELGDTTIFPLPVHWQNTYLESTDSTHHFAQLSVEQVRKIWPSLWQVKLTKPSTAEQPFLLTFNQGFDSQWVLLHNWQPVTANHVKINGWANGWIIPPTTIPESGSYYLFYWPELLNLAGWVITLSVLVVLLCKYIHHHRHLPNNHQKERLTKLIKTALYPTY